MQEVTKIDVSEILNHGSSLGPTILAIEGLDGSGKTVQCQKLCERLEADGKKVFCIDFPQYESTIGKQIGSFLSGDEQGANAETIDPKSMCLWYAVDRWQALKAVKWSEYDYVVFNRYTLSNAVYQTARCFGEPNAAFMDWVFELEHITFGLPSPNYYLFLDTEIDGCAQNLTQKGERTYVEGLDLYERSDSLLANCRRLYHYCAEKYESVQIIGCNRGGVLLSIDEIHGLIVEKLTALGLNI